MTVPEATDRTRGIKLPYDRRVGTRFIAVHQDSDSEVLPGSVFLELRDDDGMCAVEAWLSPDQRRELIAVLLAAEPGGSS